MKFLYVVYLGSIHKITRKELRRFLEAYQEGEGPDFGDYTGGQAGDAKDLSDLTTGEVKTLLEKIG